MMSEETQDRTHASDTTADDSSILGKVDFSYVNHSQVSSNNWDLRIAFGDRKPKGSIQPIMGIVMSHEHAKALLEALAKSIARLERMKGREIDYNLNIEAAKEEEEAAAE